MVISNFLFERRQEMAVDFKMVKIQLNLENFELKDLLPLHNSSTPEFVICIGAPGRSQFRDPLDVLLKSFEGCTPWALICHCDIRLVEESVSEQCPNY